MYESYYGLRENPFNLTPDTDFYYHSLTHRQALDVLKIAIDSGDGFIKLTGEVGTGKTLLCRKLLEQLDDRVQTLYIPNPYMSCEALLEALVDEMEIRARLRGNNYLAAINQQLIDNAQQGKRTVVLLDEAQSLPLESLEAIRLLSNLETRKQKLIQIVLFGQPELDHKLEHQDIRQLRQRIVHAYQLQKLSLASVGEYVQHRLKSAGYCGPALFSAAELKTLYRFSEGIPRLINLLCHKALMLAYASGAFYVSRQHIIAAARDGKLAFGGALHGLPGLLAHPVLQWRR